MSLATTCCFVGVPAANHAMAAAFVPGIILPHATTPSFSSHCPVRVLEQSSAMFRKQETSLYRRNVMLHSERRNNNNNNDDVVVNVVEQVTSTLSTPTPILKIPLGYPLALATAAALFPWSTSFLLSLFFGIYLYLGKTLADENDDSTVVDLAAFVGAIASAGLLSPQGFDGMTSDSVFRAIGVGGMGLVGATIFQTLNGSDDDNDDDFASPDEQLMDMWDGKFQDEMDQ